MRRRLILATVAAITALLMLGGTTAQAAPGSLRILFSGNQGDDSFNEFLPALRGTPGVSAVDTFLTETDTPSQATLNAHDLVVSTGDSNYGDPVLFGDRLAAYIDQGGAVIQFAYDNWEDIGAHPEGRFESGGYPPFIPGDNVNDATTLGEILAPGNPLLAGVPTFATGDNVDDALSPGATLLARFADGRNAIATKGLVASVAASPEDGGGFDPISAAAQLAVNTGNALGPRLLTVAKKGSGTVTGTGIACGATCSAQFGLNLAPTLTAKAKKGLFKGWSGGGCKGKSTCKPDISGGNTTVTATFVKCKKKKKAHKRSAEAAKKKKCKKTKKKH